MTFSELLLKSEACGSQKRNRPKMIEGDKTVIIVIVMFEWFAPEYK